MLLIELKKSLLTIKIPTCAHDENFLYGSPLGLPVVLWITRFEMMMMMKHHTSLSSYSESSVPDRMHNRRNLAVCVSLILHGDQVEVLALGLFSRVVCFAKNHIRPQSHETEPGNKPEPPPET
jgi:hypothetical protein